MSGEPLPLAAAAHRLRGKPGRPRKELTPEEQALVEQARAALRAGWASPRELLDVEGAGPTYISARELARELGCHKASVYRLAKDHPDMPQLHLGGGLIRFPHARVLAWLRRREGRPA